jgi:Helix-loop-helix DNA-binding domain
MMGKRGSYLLQTPRRGECFRKYKGDLAPRSISYKLVYGSVRNKNKIVRFRFGKVEFEGRESNIISLSPPLDSNPFFFLFLLLRFASLFSFFFFSLLLFFFLYLPRTGRPCSPPFTSWTITITTTPRTCLMAAHTAFIRLSRRRISTWSIHSKASTHILSCPPPLPRVGIILCRSSSCLRPNLPLSELQQAFQMRPMSLMANTHHPQYDSGHEFSSSPPAQSAGLMMEPGPPPSPDMYGPLSPPISGSDTSAEGAYHSRNSSSSSSRANSLVHRNPLRYNPTPSPSSSSGRRRGRSFGDSDEDMGVNIAESIAYTRKEATRRQRIEAEQRRRDELRDGYARLKDVLPVSNQKSSKVSLLERGIIFSLHPTATNQNSSLRNQPPTISCSSRN